MGTLLLAVVMFGTRSGPTDHAGYFCDVSQANSQTAMLLLDLQKPVPRERYATLLRDVSATLGAGAELQVFVLTGDWRVPRRMVGRLCKPYANEDLLADMAKHVQDDVPDCTDLPAQLPTRLRDTARTFCARRAALQSRVDRIASELASSGPVVRKAQLLDAVDASVRELATRDGSRTLVLVSDMLHHDDWYSHLDLDWPMWGSSAYLEHARAGVGRSDGSLLGGLRVDVHYLPRSGLTDDRRTSDAHMAFWRAYLGDASVTLEEEPPLPGFAWSPAMDEDAGASRSGVYRGTAPPRPAAACTIQLAPRFEVLLAEPYPGGRAVDYGDGKVTVAYRVDPRGQTVDESVTVVAPRSPATSATDAESLARLSEDSASVVRDWAFEVGDDSVGPCQVAQAGAVTFTYRRRCVGRPVQSCRTVRGTVTFLTPESALPLLEATAPTQRAAE